MTTRQGETHGVRILVVDDDESIRELAELILVDAGYSVETASDGAPGLARAIALKPDLVLLDMMMPEVDGLEFLERLPKECPGPLPKVVACSGFEKFETLVYDRGAIAFLRKPYEASALLETVAAALRAGKPGAATVAAHETFIASVHAEAESRRDTVLRVATIDDAGLRFQLDQLAAWAVGYFDVWQSLVTVLYQHRNVVLAQRCTGSCPKPSSLELHESFCTETTVHASAWVIRDPATHPAFNDHPAAVGTRFYAGVPLLMAGRIAVGSLWMVHDRSFGFRAEDLALLAHFGEIVGESIESLAKGGPVMEMFASEQLFARAVLTTIVGAELRRAERDLGALGLLITRLADVSDVPSIIRAAGARRLAVARLSDGEIAVSIGAPDVQQARTRMALAVDALVASGLSSGVKRAIFDGATSRGITAEGFIREAETS